ncbi:speckle-type POZ protein-like isoform X1 [Temnothorax nylanderi]|uniref:speckle-type POZ protein-like isoform X1 n=1 Tax=Temnothorax nylanderi TaxID=102681 RepID=UPI003A851809
MFARTPRHHLFSETRASSVSRRHGCLLKQRSARAITIISCGNRKMSKRDEHRVLPRTPDAEPSEVTPSVLFGLSNIVTRCRTNFQMRKILFEWTIENFSLCYEKTLRSSTFSEGVNKKIEWCLEMHLEGMDGESKHYLSLILIPISCRESQYVNAKCKFTILNAKKEKEVTAESCAIKLTDKVFMKKFVRRDLLLDEVNGLLPDDKLTILCEISLVDNVIFSNNPVTIPFEPDNVGLLLFENPEFSDITVLVHGREIQAHKAILAAQSHYFSRMLKSEMLEKQTNYVKIEDIDYETVREMLRFIYTGKVENPENLGKITDLLVAADKYELTKLKVMCEKILCTRLTVENAAEILILADLYRADYLKAEALDIIKSHLTDVTDTKGYKSMVNSHPHLISEVLQALAKRVKRR